MKKYLIIIATIGMACFLCFWRLGSVPVAEWDEARYGANAVEMVRTGDYVNYHYMDQLDLWNAKPPLQVWGIVLSSKIFGFNEFAMRFPSTLGILITLTFVFLIGRDLGGFSLGILFVWSAMVTRALIGYHVGRSGDMDGLFVAGLTASDYFLRRVLRDKEKSSWSWLGVGLGLSVSFFAKGFALLLVIPGYAILFFRSAWKKYLTSKHLWVGILILISFIGLWFGLVHFYGETDPSKQYVGSNIVTVMIFYDIFTRFAGGLGGEESRDPRIILAFLDTRFGALYYWLILFGIAFFVLKKKRQLVLDQTRLFKDLLSRHQSVIYSAVMAGSFLLILGISQSKLNWYVAPLAIWLPGLLWYIVDAFSVTSDKLKKWAVISAGLVLAINCGHVVRSILAASTPSPIQEFVQQKKQELQAAKVIQFYTALRQDEYLYLLWSSSGRILDGNGDRQYPSNYKMDCNETGCGITTVLDL